MNEVGVKDLISRAREVYNAHYNIPYFQKWVNSFENGDEFQVVKLIYDFIAEQNKHPGKFLLDISNFGEEQIYNFITKQNLESILPNTPRR